LGHRHFSPSTASNKFIPPLELLEVEGGNEVVGAVCCAMIDESRMFWEERGINRYLIFMFITNPIEIVLICFGFPTKNQRTQPIIV